MAEIIGEAVFLNKPRQQQYGCAGLCVSSSKISCTGLSVPVLSNNSSENTDLKMHLAPMTRIAAASFSLYITRKT